MKWAVVRHRPFHYCNNCNNFKYHNDNFYQNHPNKKNIYFTTNWHVTSTVTLLITFQMICILHLVRYSPLCSLISDRWKSAYWRWRLDNGVPKQQHDPNCQQQDKTAHFWTFGREVRATLPSVRLEQPLRRWTAYTAPTGWDFTAACCLAIFQTIQLSSGLDEDSVDYRAICSTLLSHAGLIHYCHW